MIHLTGDQAYTSQEGIFKKAREEAAKIGANGILFTGMEEGKTTWNWLSGTSSSSLAAATVLTSLAE